MRGQVLCGGGAHEARAGGYSPDVSGRIWDTALKVRVGGGAGPPLGAARDSAQVGGVASWSSSRCGPGGFVLGDRPSGIRAEATATLTALPWPHGSSDDRSPEAFRTRIEAATQMELVLGSGGRPNCLVIDEIDGAPTVGLLGAWWLGRRAGRGVCSS